MSYSRVIQTVALMFLFIVLMPTHGHAATVYSNPIPTGELASPGSVTDSFAAGAGAGTLTFQLAGYVTLDGANVYEDDFTLQVNGSTLVRATFDLGGGGGTFVYQSPAGSLFSQIGKTVDIVVPVSLVGGINTISFIYDSPTGDAFSGPGPHAGPQGTGDEGWGINSVDVQGSAAVPEPATGLLMMLGISGLAIALLRKQTAL